MKYIIAFFIVLVTAKNFAQPVLPVPEIWNNDSWSGTNWSQFSNTTYTFNNQCLPISVLALIVNITTSEFQNSVRTNYTYQNNQITEGITEIWDENAQTWNLELRTTQSYTNGNLVEIILYRRINNAWQLENKSVNSYSNATLIETLHQNWDETNSLWINFERDLFVYDSDGLLEVETTQEWDIQSMSWINDKRILYTYIANATRFDTKTTEKWENNNWMNDEVEIFTYDTNDLITTSLEQKWDITTSQYNNKERKIYTNNSDGFTTEIISQNGVFGSWLNTGRDTRTYNNCAILDVEEQMAGFNFIIYPNPSTDYIKIKIDFNFSDLSMEIINSQGKMLLKKPLNNSNNNINISYLSKGIYIIRVKNNEFVTTKKIIIR